MALPWGMFERVLQYPSNAQVGTLGCRVCMLACVCVCRGRGGVHWLGVQKVGATSNVAKAVASGLQEVEAAAAAASGDLTKALQF
eukprot:1156182-Pelagomonas_calceolata.AAC.4